MGRDCALRPLAILQALLLLAACQASAEPLIDRRVVATDSTVFISGDQRWFVKTRQNERRLYGLILGSSRCSIEWPPPDAARRITISVDVSQSVRTRSARNDGGCESLLSLQRLQLRRYLETSAVLGAGDCLLLRLMAYDRHTGQANRTVYGPYCSQAYSIRGTVLDQIRASHSLVFTVESVSAAGVSDAARDLAVVADSVMSVIVDEYSSPTTLDATLSLLFQHLVQVLRQGRLQSSASRVVLVVTDGHVDLGDIYFAPGRVGKLDAPAVMRHIVDAGLPPKLPLAADESVGFIGLSSEGDAHFQNLFEEVMRDYLDANDSRLEFYWD